MVIVIDDYGVSVNKRNKSFLIGKGETHRQISPFRVTAIHVRKGCDLSSPAILLAAKHDIPILFFDSRGKVLARLWQARYGSHVDIRRAQLRWSESEEGLAWVVACLVQKAKGQAKVLKWLANRVPAQAAALTEAIEKIKVLRKALASLANHDVLEKEAIRTQEGQIGRIYWEAYFDALEKHEPADKRSRQPAADPLNALINYGYGMLYGEVESAVLTTGLDPFAGVLHRDEYNKPSFVFDAIEPFRHWVDRLVAELVLEGELKKAWFDTKKGSYWLSKEGKRNFIPAWYRMILTTTKFTGKHIKRKDQIQYAMSQLAKGFMSPEEEET